MFPIICPRDILTVPHVFVYVRLLSTLIFLLPWRQGRLAMQEDVIKGLTSRPRVSVG